MISENGGQAANPVRNGRSMEEALGRQLRAEAPTPVFSAELHQRVMDKLGTEGLQGGQAEGEWGRGEMARRWMRMAALPLAAAAALGIVAWIFRAPAGPPEIRPVPGVTQVDSLDPSALVAPVRAVLAAPAAEAWERGRYGYLDQDARRLAVFVADQILNLPGPQERPRP